MIQYIKSAIVMMVVLFTIVTASAQWSEPNAAPPGGNVAPPINTGPAAQVKSGNLTVNKLTTTLTGPAVIGLETGNISATDIFTGKLFARDQVIIDDNPFVSSLATIKRITADGTISARRYCNYDDTICTTTPSGGGDGMPSGAVVAFDGACPANWTHYTPANGRNIIGMGTGDYAGSVTTRALGDRGGNEERLISVNNLPPHRHKIDGNTFGGGSNPQGKDSGNDDYIKQEPLTKSESGVYNSAGTLVAQTQFAIMDPYVALNYCKKD